MEFNRNQFFLIGVIVVLLGVQFRLVESITLNERSTRFLLARAQETGDAPFGAGLLPSVGPIPRKVIYPPTWLGWALVSVGSVLILHSLAMKKPGG